MKVFLEGLFRAAFTRVRQWELTRAYSCATCRRSRQAKVPEGEDGSRARRTLAAPQRRSPVSPPVPFRPLLAGRCGGYRCGETGESTARRPAALPVARAAAPPLPRRAPARRPQRAPADGRPPLGRPGAPRPSSRHSLRPLATARLGCGSAAALAPWLPTANISPCAIPPLSAARPPPARCSACSTSGGPRPSTGEPDGARREGPGASGGGARGRAGRSGAQRPGPGLSLPWGSLPPTLGTASWGGGGIRCPGSAARIVFAFLAFPSASSR